MSAPVGLLGVCGTDRAPHRPVGFRDVRVLGMRAQRHERAWSREATADAGVGRLLQLQREVLDLDGRSHFGAAVRSAE